MNKQNPTAFWFRNHFSCKIFTFRTAFYFSRHAANLALCNSVIVFIPGTSVCWMRRVLWYSD